MALRITAFARPALTLTQGPAPQVGDRRLQLCSCERPASHIVSARARRRLKSQRQAARLIVACGFSSPSAYLEVARTFSAVFRGGVGRVWSDTGCQPEFAAGSLHNAAIIETWETRCKCSKAIQRPGCKVVSAKHCCTAHEETAARSCACCGAMASRCQQQPAQLRVRTQSVASITDAN